MPSGLFLFDCVFVCVRAWNLAVPFPSRFRPVSARGPGSSDAQHGVCRVVFVVFLDRACSAILRVCCLLLLLLLAMRGVDVWIYIALDLFAPGPLLVCVINHWFGFRPLFVFDVVVLCVCTYTSHLYRTGVFALHYTMVSSSSSSMSSSSSLSSEA